MGANKLCSGKPPLLCSSLRTDGFRGRAWCDFVIYTKSIAIERIYFDEDYWLHTCLLPKLVDFDSCLGPEIVSPLHVLGIPIRNLSK